MKIKIGKKVYLQRYDLDFAVHKLCYIPRDFRDELSEKKMWNRARSDDQKSALNFDCVFEKPGSVAWIMEQNWILDYEELNQMSIVDVKALLFKQDARFHALIDKWNKGDIVETIRARSDLNRKKHIIDSIEIMIEYREGRMQPKLPAAMYRKKSSNGWLKSIFSAI